MNLERFDFDGVRMPSDFRGGAESGPVSTYRLSEEERLALITRLGPPRAERRRRMTARDATSPPARGQLRERILALAAEGLDASQIARQAKTSERVVLTTLVHEEAKTMPEPLSEELRERIRQLTAEGKSCKAIAKELGVGVASVIKYRHSPAPVDSATPAKAEEVPTAPTETKPEPAAPAPSLEDLSRRLERFGERVVVAARLSLSFEEAFGADARPVVIAMLQALDVHWQQLKGA